MPRPQTSMKQYQFIFLLTSSLKHVPKQEHLPHSMTILLAYDMGVLDRAPRSRCRSTTLPPTTDGLDQA
jgi:hypothetical protein